MASVAVDFKAFSDGRFKVLGKLVNSNRFDARARVEEIWRHCVEENTYDVTGIIIDALAEIDGFAENMVDAGLAERKENGIYRVRGTKGRVEWLEGARERQKNATEAAKMKRREDQNRLKATQGSLFKSTAESDLGSEVGTDLGSDEPPTLESYTASASVSSSASASVSDSSQNEIKEKKPRAKKRTAVRAEDPNLGKHTQAIIAAFCEAWKERYKTNPLIDGADAGAAQRFAKMTSISAVRKLEIIDAYLVMNDEWFIKKRHDLPTLLSNLKAVHLKLETGFAPTQGEIRNLDRKQTTANTFGDLIAKAERREQGRGRNEPS